MMLRDVHLKPMDLLYSLQYKPGDLGDVAIISGQPQRAKMCLEQLENPVKNFSFLGYTFWTGLYKGKKVTVGNGGWFAPDSAFMTELICVAGVETIIRLGSCGSLREDIKVGDFVIADKVIRGDGATKYYVKDDFVSKVDKTTTDKLVNLFKTAGDVAIGGVWTTDALFKETKEIVNENIAKGAVAVDMVTSPFVTIANLYNKKAAVVMSVSDNLITGELGFTNMRFIESEMKMVKVIFGLVS